METPFEIFLVCPPGLESFLADEAREAGFAVGGTMPGGVTVTGDWTDVWRANIALRGAGRVLVRMGSFRAFHLAQLDKRARKFPWDAWLRPDVPFVVEAVTKASKIYHAGAARQRIARAITEEFGAPEGEGGVRVMARIEDNLVTLSVDTSGEALHRRGFKQAVGKAPMRETMAALFLRACGYRGQEPVVDPMCGSGTFVIEAAEMAAGLLPGRGRGFAFERLAGYDADRVAALRKGGAGDTAIRFHGSDRDQGAIAGAAANAERAGVGPLCSFERRAVSDAVPPDGPPGLVIVNPPYGARVGNRKPLFALHGAFGQVMLERFSGWRVGLVTSDAGLAKATGLPFDDPGPIVAHGGLKVRLWQTGPLP